MPIIVDDRKTCDRHRLQVIAAEARMPVGSAYRRRITLQFGRRKNQRRRHLHRGLEHDVPRGRQIKRLQVLADPLGKRVATKQEHRHIGPQTQANLLQTLARQTELPEMIERQQYRRRIGTATTDATTHRQVFFQMNVGPLPTAGFSLQQPRRTQRQIAFRRHPRQRIEQAQLTVLTWRKAQVVTVIDQAEKRLQQVIAICPPPDDVQKKIQFGRSRVNTVPVHHSFL